MFGNIYYSHKSMETEFCMEWTQKCRSTCIGWKHAIFASSPCDVAIILTGSMWNVTMWCSGWFCMFSIFWCWLSCIKPQVYVWRKECGGVSSPGLQQQLVKNAYPSHSNPLRPSYMTQIALPPSHFAPPFQFTVDAALQFWASWCPHLVVHVVWSHIVHWVGLWWKEHVVFQYLWCSYTVWIRFDKCNTLWEVNV